MNCFKKVMGNFNYKINDGENYNYNQIQSYSNMKIYCFPKPFENENGEEHVDVVNANMAFLDILNSNGQFCGDRAGINANRWGNNLNDEERIKLQSSALILHTIRELYKKNNESFDEKQVTKYRNGLHRYLPLDGMAVNCTMTIETAVDIGAALNLKYDLFGTKSIDSFLDNYKKYIRVFVRSKTLNFYARSLEDICSAYCIFHLKTRNTYKSLLKTFETVVKEVQVNTEDRAPAIEDTFQIYNQLLEIMKAKEETFIEKLSILIRRKPYNFTVRRYKEIVSNVLKFFCTENLLSKEDYNSYEYYLFLNPEVIRRITRPKKEALLNKILKVEKNQLLYLNIILETNAGIPAGEDTVMFLRALTILYMCQQFIEDNYTSQDLFNIINNRLTALGLSNLTYNRQYCHNLFDWSVGRLIEETKQQRIRNY